MQLLAYLAVTLLPAVLASPAPVPTLAKRAAGGTALASVPAGSGVGGTTCTATNLAQVTSFVKTCSNVLVSGVSIPPSSTLSVTVPTSGALLFAGTMTVGYTPDASYTPIVLAGTHAKVAGLAGAVIDGQGAKYWDGLGSNTGASPKPNHFIKLNKWVSSNFGNIKIRNWPTHLFSVTGGDGVTMTNLLLDNSAGASLGHNTDAFDVSTTNNFHVKTATVYNQDDCVAINSGTNMVFENMYCSGGHGLSVGSIDSGVTVKNITFKDSSVISSQNACRIKTIAGATGSTVTDVTYSNIVVKDITKYAIDVQQDYLNGSPNGKPTTGVTVSGVTFEEISGTVSSSGYDYYILCGSDTSCKSFTWSGITLTGGQTSCSPKGSAVCP